MSEAHLWVGLGIFTRTLFVLCVCFVAYSIRLHSVRQFGNVIHEFDPYFNFRATEYGLGNRHAMLFLNYYPSNYLTPSCRYLVDNGWNKFINWYDDRSWYPLGRYACFRY